MAPVLNAFASIVQSTKGQPIYHVAMIFTDGQLHDVSETKSLLVTLSHLPCSVVLIGLGKLDFTEFHEFDCDRGRLTDDEGN